MASGDTKTEALLNILGNGGDASEYRGCCNTKTQSYILDAIDRVQNVEEEVEELKNNPDVVDIVDTYADLQAYDTQHLTENDIIRVLQDETHSGNSTYYRFTKNPDTWTFIGEISGGGGGGATGEAKALTTADYNANSNDWYDTDPTHFNCVALWKLTPGMYRRSANNVTVKVSNSENLSVKDVAMVGVWGDYGVYMFIFTSDNLFNNGPGYGKVRTVDHTTGSPNAYYSFNLFKVVDDLTSSYDEAPLSARQGKVLKTLVDSLVIQNAGAPTTSTVGTVGQLLEDTTNGKLYQCTAIDTTDPQNPSYTWTEVGAGGGGPTVVQATGDSTTDVMSQDATTKLVYPSGNNYRDRVGIGLYARVFSAGGVAIGGSARVESTASGAVVLGQGAKSEYQHSVALGEDSATTRQGEVFVGCNNNNYGYNNTKLRVIGGVHDPVDTQDAATKGYVDSHSSSATISNNTLYV